MSEDNPIRIFVTHTFSDHPDHARVFEYLESATNFFYKNCSDPSKIPGSGDADALRKELRRQIESAEIVLIPAGMYDEHYDSLKFQMATAKEGGVPIVALELFGGVGEAHRDVGVVPASGVGRHVGRGGDDRRDRVEDHLDLIGG